MVQIVADETFVDDGVEVARKGDLGDVIEEGAEYEWGEQLMNVRWQRTGRVFGVEVEKVKVLCHADFATRPETTPVKGKKDHTRRNVQ